MSTTIKVRRDTAANWTSVNPTLNAGEIGLETDTGQIKIGDGATAWVTLTYGPAIPTAALEAHAVTQAGMVSGTTSFPSTNSTTPVLIPEMTQTLITTGGDLIVSFYTGLSNSTANADVYVGISVDGGAPSLICHFNALTTQLPFAFTGRITGLAAGSHTFNVMWYTTTGTLTADYNRRYFVVEELKR